MTKKGFELEENKVPQDDKPLCGELISAKKVQEIYGIERSWLYDRIEDGTIPFPYSRLSPRKIRFKKSAIEKWLNTIEHPAGTKPGNIKKEAAM